MQICISQTVNLTALRHLIAALISSAAKGISSMASTFTNDSVIRPCISLFALATGAFSSALYFLMSLKWSTHVCTTVSWSDVVFPFTLSFTSWHVFVVGFLNWSLWFCLNLASKDCGSAWILHQKTVSSFSSIDFDSLSQLLARRDGADVQYKSR